MENEKIHKIFFIYASQRYYVQNIQINPEKNKFIQNFKNELTQEFLSPNRLTYIIRLYSISFDLEKVDEEIFTLNLEYKNNTFKSEKIKFNKLKDNFIYNYKFNDYSGFFKNVSPPEKYSLSLLNQFNIFNEYLSNNNLKKSPTKESLISESIKQLKEISIDFEFYLSIFRECYFEKNVKSLLLFFKPDKIVVKDSMDPSKYQTIINLVVKKPNLIKVFDFSEFNNKFLKASISKYL